MLNFTTKNLSKIEPDHGLSNSEIEKQYSLLEPFLLAIKEKKQGFYEVIDDAEIIQSIKTFVNNVKGQFDAVVVLGIGGSALGTICLQQSLKHLFEKNRTSEVPNLYVLDNIDPQLLMEINDVIDLKRTLFIVTTKSGSTPETLAQYFYFRKKCDKMKLNAKKHFVFITDLEKGFLREIAQKENIPAFALPQNVGGRFSVLTAVGLLPAELSGIDSEKLLRGAQTMRNLFLSKDPQQNLPFQLATMQYLLWKKGKNINVMMPYAQKLIRFADWYRQLLAESIGKKTNTKGEEIFVGITPINALGVTDQHSQSQLYNEGPNDKFHLFLSVKNLGPELEIPSLYPQEKSLQYLEGVSFNQLLITEMEGTLRSLTQNNRPNITIEIDAIHEHALGELFMLFEAATAFLGEFFEINAFDQPGVELSKQITKKLLQETKK